MSAALSRSTTTQQAIVYVLFEVRTRENDQVEFSTVYIAARTSAEAVQIWRRLSNFGSEPLAFVQSDDVRERDPMAAVRRAGNGAEVVSRAQYEQWVSIMTRDDWHDGERSPATFVRVEPRVRAAA